MFVELAVAAALLAVSAAMTYAICTWLQNESIFGDWAPERVTRVHQEEYTQTDCDKAYVQASRQVLTNVLGEHPIQRLMGQSGEKRIAAIKNLMEQLQTLYGLKDLTVCLHWEIDTESSGAYCWEINQMDLYLMPLLNSNEETIKDFLDTIFHELRHAVQCKMLSEEGVSDYRWSNDRERLELIYENFHNYIRPSADIVGYYHQFVEVDAREIAMSILEGTD